MVLNFAHPHSSHPMKSFYYKAYGLNIESVLRCPELLEGGGTPDVHIRYGDVPTYLEGAKEKNVLYQAKPNQFLLQLDDIARFMISDGKEILIAPAKNSRDDEIRLFLLGSALGALLHQRGILILHGSAIETSNGAVVFVGPSGSGKSTLAGALQARGYRILADDICAVSFDDTGVPLVRPAYPQIKIWADTAEVLKKETQYLRRIRPNFEKYALSIAESFSQSPRPLSCVYALATTNTHRFDLKPLQGIEKFQVLINNTYRYYFLEGLGMQSHHFLQAAAVTKYALVRLVTRPRHPLLLKELTDLLEKDFASADEQH